MMNKVVLLILILVSDIWPVWAQSVAVDDIQQLQKEMYQLYNQRDEAAFIDVRDQPAEGGGPEGWRRRPLPRSASRANCALPATFRCRWCHRPSPSAATSIYMD